MWDLIDPEILNMPYNFSSALCTYLADKEAALEMSAPVFASITDSFLPYAKADPDLVIRHDEPRFHEMIAEAEARLTGEPESPAI